MAPKRKPEPHPHTCPLCPLRETGKACPAWISEQAGFLETHDVTKEQRFITGCFFQVIPKLMVHVIKATDQGQAAVESSRNVIARGFNRVADGLAQAVPVMVEHAFLTAKERADLLIVTGGDGEAHKIEWSKPNDPDSWDVDPAGEAGG